MDALDLTQILVQAPIVAIFAWFVWKNNEQWRKFLESRNSKTEKVMDSVASHLEALQKSNEIQTRVLVQLVKDGNLRDQLTDS